MKENSNPRWSEGLKFVQLQKNSRHHSGIKRAPFQAAFRIEPRQGVGMFNIPDHVIGDLETEEQLDELLGSTSTTVPEQETTESGVGDENASPDETTYAVLENFKRCVACSELAGGAHTCLKCKQICHAISPCGFSQGMHLIFSEIRDKVN
jgi:hypothetical protein